MIVELPEEIGELIRDHARDPMAMRYELGLVGWVIVPVSVVPQAAPYEQVADMLRAAAMEAGSTGLHQGSLAGCAELLDQLRMVAAELLGVDLMALREHVTGEGVES